MADRPQLDDAHYRSAFFDLESPIADMNGATALFMQVFRNVFDKHPDEKRGEMDVFVLSPQEVTAMEFAANVLDRANDATHTAYYAGHGETVGQ